MNLVAFILRPLRAQVCAVIGHAYSWKEAAGLGMPRPVCLRCGHTQEKWAA